MTNWVETVQSQAFNGPSDLEDAKLFEQIDLESDEDDDYGSEGFSDVHSGMHGKQKNKKRKN